MRNKELVLAKVERLNGQFRILESQATRMSMSDLRQHLNLMKENLEAIKLMVEKEENKLALS